MTKVGTVGWNRMCYKLCCDSQWSQSQSQSCSNRGKGVSSMNSVSRQTVALPQVESV
jgi:hypothetical protein